MKEMQVEKKIRKNKVSRFATSFSMRFDSFTLDMLDRIAWDEDKTRPEVIRSAVKFLFLKKYNMEELESLREKHRGNLELLKNED
jgi:predicted transcriptional regulator